MNKYQKKGKKGRNGNHRIEVNLPKEYEPYKGVSIERRNEKFFRDMKKSEEEYE
ncbi:MAG: hypothetical protein ACTSVV_00180 [Promethearchaeota archaeon]